MAALFDASESFVTQGPTALFLGSGEPAPASPPGRARRTQQTAPGNRAQPPEILVATEPLSSAMASARADAAAASAANAVAVAAVSSRRNECHARAAAASAASAVAAAAHASSAEDAMSFYFEACIKTTGGGLQPSGSVGVGVVFCGRDRSGGEGEAVTRGSDGREQSDSTQSQPCRRYLHYHSSRGARGQIFPRVPRNGSTSVGWSASQAVSGSFEGGVPYGPSFSVGDTVGCGWEAEAGLYFTLNGRHLGIAWMPTALFALLTPTEQVRSFRYGMPF